MISVKASVTLGAALVMSAVLTSATEAMPVAQLQAEKGAPALLEEAQFIFGGRNYCFYPDGWHGPGWYWCGYAHRRGFGWGGPRGWHDWHAGPGRVGRPGPGPGPGRGHIGPAPGLGRHGGPGGHMGGHSGGGHHH